mmetsp:Transcript_62338/g.109856  ORF Transcript_62338/g.109856 Transcript_62338/m.109856 type:complete len:312 (+) Transcript_62338:329-1264(+)
MEHIGARRHHVAIPAHRLTCLAHRNGSTVRQCFTGNDVVTRPGELQNRVNPRERRWFVLVHRPIHAREIRRSQSQPARPRDGVIEQTDGELVGSAVDRCVGAHAAAVLRVLAGRDDIQPGLQVRCVTFQAHVQPIASRDEIIVVCIVQLNLKTGAAVAACRGLSQAHAAAHRPRRVRFGWENGHLKRRGDDLRRSSTDHVCLEVHVHQVLACPSEQIGSGGVARTVLRLQHRGSHLAEAHLVNEHNVKLRLGGILGGRRVVVNVPIERAKGQYFPSSAAHQPTSHRDCAGLVHRGRSHREQKRCTLDKQRG